MKIAMIAAMTENRVLGKNNEMIWSLPKDLKHFKNMTMGHPIIIGRKTFESFKKHLPGRTNIVITRNPDYHLDECVVVHSLDTALEEAKKYYDETIFIAGGAEIYKQALPYADILYLTHIKADLEGDAYFPEFSLSEWRETSREAIKADERHCYDFDFVTWERIK
jgi:dihydrofolate reductase